MNHITAGKIHGTDLCQESAFAPYHMCHRIVYQNRPEQNKEKQGFEFYPSHQGSRDQRRCDQRKHDAEEDAVIGTAIDLRRLIQLSRNTVNKVADLVYEEALDCKEIWDDQWFVGTNPA